MTKQFLSIILLAGGIGSRMKTSIPKQFLQLNHRPIAHHSLDILLGLPEVKEVVVVCDTTHRHYFDTYSGLKWALPGNRRQDSVYNGLQQICPEASHVCIHDACRPYIDQELVARVLKAATDCGASAAAMPLPFTIKETNEDGYVIQTPDRSRYWEIQTPQILKRDLLVNGFNKAIADNLTVTDDTSLAELLGAPVKLVEGSIANIKITSPEDMSIAEALRKNHG